jgi:integrase
MKKPIVQLVQRRGRSLEYRVYFPAKRERVYIATGIETDHYNSVTHYIDNKDPDYYSKINKLTEVQNEVNLILAKMFNESMTVDANKFRNMRGGITVHTDKTNDFILFVSSMIDKQGTLSEGTKRHQRRTLALLRDMKPVIYMDEIGYSLAIEFDVFLRKQYSNQNTITRHHKTLRKYVKIALGNMLLDHDKANSFNMYKVPGYSANKQPHTPEDLAALEALDYSFDHRLRSTMDAYLFSCYTGLRISDTFSIRTNNFSNVNGELRLVKVMVKLKKQNLSVNLPIEKLFNGKPANIVRPYIELHKDGEKIFNKSHQETNRMLKIIASDAGLPEFSFHKSRHTFLTNLAIATKDVFLVMRYGGIANMNTAQGYINVASRFMDESLEKVVWK